jgi:hypothetical protein
LVLKPIVSGVGLLAVTAAACAQSPGLSGPQITELVAGATVEIDTPSGTKLPVRYAPEGRLSGEARELAWYLGSALDVGRWWVTGDRLCHKWTRWFNGEPQCMQVAKDGRIIRWRSQDGNSGTAAIAIPAPLQASTLLALPRVFPRRTPPAAQPEPPPALTGPAPPRLQEPVTAPAPAEFAAVAIPPTAPPAAGEAIAKVEPLPPVAPPPVPAVKSPPRQVETKQPEPRSASVPPPRQTEPGKQAEPKHPASPTFMVANVRPDDVLNVRSGPSADHDIVAELAPGSRGIAITSECRSRWCPVQHDGAAGWVNSVYLVPEGPATASLRTTLNDGPASPLASPPADPALRDSPEAPRSCLKPAARALLDRIEQKFGPVQVVSTCRVGAVIAGTSHPSRHASGNAVDFKAGPRKAAILQWLIATHRAGGTMTYAGLDHIHVDIGPHFISLAGGRHTSSWRGGPRDASGPQAADTSR